jgi:hypothetical protein
VVVGGESGREFLTTIEPEEIIAFYRERLIPEGWAPEGEPLHQSWPSLNMDYVTEAITWSLVRGDIRLMLGTQASPRGPSGEMAWALTMQPVWYNGWDTGETIPAPPTDTTPIPIGPDYADENIEGQP